MKLKLKTSCKLVVGQPVRLSGKHVARDKQGQIHYVGYLVEGISDNSIFGKSQIVTSAMIKAGEDVLWNFQDDVSKAKLVMEIYLAMDAVRLTDKL